MKDQKIPSRYSPSMLFLSFFGSGYFPVMPGTIGSLATIPLIYLISYLQINLIYLILFISILFFVACRIAEKVQNLKDVQDPGWIVIDEVIGMLITWCFIFPSTDPLSLAAVFVTFRFFDIVKVFPANYLDKKMKSGAGTIVDDVVSALYAGMITYCLKINLLII